MEIGIENFAAIINDSGSKTINERNRGALPVGS